MQEVLLMIIGSLSVVMMLGFTIYAGYLLFTKCYRSFRYNHSFNQVPIDDQPQIVEEIHCDDIKATVITISQHQQINEALDNEHQMVRYDQRPTKGHWRQRSMSDPDLLADSVVALAIESQSQSPLKSHRNSPYDENKSSLANCLSESTDSIRTEEDFDQSISMISPLSSPKGTRNSSKTASQHHRTEEHSLQIPGVSQLIQNSEIQSLINNQTVPIERASGQLEEDTVDIVDEMDSEEEKDVVNSDAASNDLESETDDSLSSLTMIVDDNNDTQEGAHMNPNNSGGESENNAEDNHTFNESQILSRNPFLSHKINSSSAWSGSGSSLTERVITRAIIGDPDVRIVHDEPYPAVSMPSDTNFSYSTNTSQYTGFMKPTEQNLNETKKDEDKKLKSQRELFDADTEYKNENNNEEIKNGKKSNEDASINDGEEEESKTVTYDNSPENYHDLHGIKAVPSRLTPDEDEPQKSFKIEGEEKEESGIFQYSNENNEGKQKSIDPINCDVKQKISEYKENIRNLVENSAQKSRRKSVNILKESRFVKAKRDLFENNDI